MQMLTPWIQDATGRAIRALEGRNPNDAANQVARITGVNAAVPSVRIRPDTGQHPDALNWAEGHASLDNEGWCNRMLKHLGYALPEEGAYVIQYDDGAFNLGPEDTDRNGFTAGLAEASRYSTHGVAQEKLRDLLNPDGTGARIVCVRDLDLRESA